MFWQIDTEAEFTHCETAVHSRDKHDAHQDDEAGDEEANHQTGAGEKQRDYLYDHRGFHLILAVTAKLLLKKAIEKLCHVHEIV